VGNPISKEIYEAEMGLDEELDPAHGGLSGRNDAGFPAKCPEMVTTQNHGM
jgi:hypothetical protein